MRVQQWRSSAPWILMADYAAPQVAWRQVLWDDLVEMAGFFGDLGSYILGTLIEHGWVWNLFLRI